MSTTGILTAKGLGDLFLPPAFGIGLVILKNMVNGYSMYSMPMYVDIGVTAASFMITDVVGDLLGATQQYDDGTFGKTMEAIIIEPLLFGGMYSVSRKMMLQKYFSIGYVSSGVEGALLYSSARFFADPFVAVINANY